VLAFGDIFSRIFIWLEENLPHPFHVAVKPPPRSLELQAFRIVCRTPLQHEFTREAPESEF